MRKSVPMCGSTASNRRRSAALAVTANRSARQRTRLLQALDAAVPVVVHLIGGRSLRRADQPESQPLRVRLIPDALRQLRILLLPGGVGRDAGGAAHNIRRVVPGSAADGMWIE